VCKVMNIIRVLFHIFLAAAASGQGYDGHSRKDFDARRLQAGTHSSAATV